MTFARIAVVVTFLVAFAPGTVAFGQPPSDEALVRQTVEAYFHGLRFYDVASLKKAFLPEAKLYFITGDGGLGSLTQEDWYQGFAENAGKQREGTFSILSVDVTGAAALVKTKLILPATTYTDYLSLLKIDGSWKIVNKIFVSEKTPPAAPPKGSQPN